MKKILIAFDIDGTLRDNSKDESADPMLDRGRLPEANEDIRNLLIILSKFKNVEILVWSGGGELYARQVCQALGIMQYVDRFASKWLSPDDGMGVHTPHPDIQPDIAIDDIHECILGKINLIVKQK